MITIFSVLFFCVCLSLCLYAALHRTKEDKEEREKLFMDKIKKHAMEHSSICIEVDGCRIMLRKEFIDNEWSKTDETGTPLRGKYESEIHFKRRLTEYNKKHESTNNATTNKDANKKISPEMNNFIREMNKECAQKWEEFTGIKRNKGESDWNYMIRVKPYKDRIVALQRKQQELEELLKEEWSESNNQTE